MPLTVTDPKMTRFIMSLNEAALLILKATQISNDGEVLILKMLSVKIGDLAKEIVKVYGEFFSSLTIKQKIIFTDKREGERLHELLITPSEISFCHDVGTMYKIKKIRSKKKIIKSNFSSETAPKISQKELNKIIRELFNEFYGTRNKF